MSTANPLPSEPENAADLAIIIVSWNVRQLLAACLQSVTTEIETHPLAVEVWVVDNDSHDGSAKMVAADFPWVKLIASPNNLGFAGGNNAALRELGFPEQQMGQPASILLLNPDTVLQAGALKTLIDFMKARPEVGLAGANLTYGDGTFQHSAFRFPGLWQLVIDLFPMPGRLYESRLNGRYARTLYTGSTPFPIDHPLGAAMLVRREAIHQVGLMDESYHMYVEEVDWSWRIKAAGWQAYCVPTAHITHFEGQSTRQIKAESFVNLWHSRYQFYRKYYRGLHFQAARALVVAGMKRNMKTNPEQAETFRKVQAIWQGPPE